MTVFHQLIIYKLVPGSDQVRAVKLGYSDKTSPEDEGGLIVLPTTIVDATSSGIDIIEFEDFKRAAEVDNLAALALVEYHLERARPHLPRSQMPVPKDRTKLLRTVLLLIKEEV